MDAIFNKDHKQLTDTYNNSHPGHPVRENCLCPYCCNDWSQAGHGANCPVIKTPEEKQAEWEAWANQFRP